MYLNMNMFAYLSLSIYPCLYLQYFKNARRLCYSRPQIPLYFPSFFYGLYIHKHVFIYNGR